MDILTKPNRATLKSYFVKNAIPTADNFADLIDGLINQQDDGIAKLPGEPLRLTTEASDAGFMKVINFYKSLSDQNPAWSMSLNPRVDPANADSAKPGWSIGDADGNSKLFIDENTGNVGISSVTPFGKLDVNGMVRVSSLFNASKDPDSGMSNGGSLVIKSNAPQIDFIDTDHNDWSIHVNSNKMYFIRQPWNYKDLVLDGAGNVGIGTDSPVAKLEVNGTAVISNGNSYATKHNFMASGSLTIGSITADYGGGKSWNPSTAGLLLEAKDNTEIAVHDSGTRVASLMYFEGSSANRITIGRDMGWGPIKQVVFAGAITPAAGNSENAGIMFKKNAFGGGGDAAWLRYYARSGEATTLELGTSNDRNDHIALMSSGNVGIGKNDPGVKLDVAGDVRAKSFLGRFAGFSDIRLKKDVKKLDNAMAKLQSLRGISFSWKDKDMMEGEQIGVVAQEVEKVFPELVMTIDDKKAVNYQGLIPVLIEAVKEQQVHIGELRTEIQMLRAD